MAWLFHLFILLFCFVVTIACFVKASQCLLNDRRSLPTFAFALVWLGVSIGELMTNPEKEWLRLDVLVLFLLAAYTLSHLQSLKPMEAAPPRLTDAGSSPRAAPPT